MISSSEDGCPLPPRRVLIVGAGPCGLAALKEMQEAGFEALVVEGRSQIGGVFSPESNVTYDNLYLTTNNMFMAFSDFPPLEKMVKYWSKTEYYNYLVQYVRHFALRPRIRLDTAVQNASLQPDKTWRVRMISYNDNKDTTATTTTSTTETFDFLIVATGANQKPYIPDIFSGYTGEILHSSDYNSARQVQGRSVLIVGHGESATDVAVSASGTASSVALWARRCPNVAPRFLSHMLHSTDYNEAKYLREQNDTKYRPNDFVDIATNSRIVRNLPLGVWSVALHGLMADIKAAHGPTSTAGVTADLTVTAHKDAYFSSDMATAPTKTFGICTATATRAIDLIVAPALSSCHGTQLGFDKPVYVGAEFTPDQDTAQVEAEVIVACTGYHTSFDWLDVSDYAKAHGLPALDLNPRSWFKHALPAGAWAEHLAFVGYARPHQGGIPQCAELVSRYLAQLLRGACHLPPDHGAIAQREAACERACFHGNPHYDVLVDYPGFMASVARLVGCDVAIPTTPRDMVQYWTFPLWPCFFRTQGVGANPAACRAVLDQFGTYEALAPMPLLALEVLFTWLMPWVNLVYFLFGSGGGGTDNVPPRGYEFRVSKFNLMHGNTLQWTDFTAAWAQWGAALFITLHCIEAYFFKSFGSTVGHHQKKGL